MAISIRDPRTPHKAEHLAVSMLKEFLIFRALAWFYDHILMEYYEICLWNMNGLYIDGSCLLVGSRTWPPS